MIVMALSAVGLSADFKKMLKTGVETYLLRTYCLVYCSYCKYNCAVYYTSNIVRLIIELNP